MQAMKIDLNDNAVSILKKANISFYPGKEYSEESLSLYDEIVQAEISCINSGEERSSKKNMK